MTVHAFIDESIRRSVYLMGVVLIDPSHSAQARSALRDLVPNGQRRIHFNGEKDGTRRRILSQVARIPFD